MAPRKTNQNKNRRAMTCSTPVSLHPSLLEGLPFGIMQMDQSYVIQEINAEGARLLGQTPVQLLGTSYPSIWSTLTQLDRSTVELQLQQVITSGHPMRNSTLRLCRGTAETIPVEWTCMAINHADGTRVVVTIRDRSREEELQQERDRLAAIAENSPAPVIELDHDAHLLYANPVMTSWLEKLGYGADGFPTVLPQGLPQLVERCFGSGDTILQQDVVLPEASFSWTFCPLTEQQLVRGYAIDTTEIHRTQQALRHTAEQLQDSNRQLDQALTAAQESARVKTAFLATISHELRTPMNGVIGMTSLLIDTPLSAEQRSYADTIRECGEALLRLINDVLETSKIEAGKLELERLDFDLRATVDAVLTQFAERAEAKGLELTGLVHAAVPTALRGDPGRLRQVLTNLVGNAIKFTDRGEVTVQAYLESEEPDTALVRFEVTDSGIGLTQDAQDKLFKPFVQADSSTTRKYGGTGLGLSISKQLIELMGGQVGIMSKPGQGSTFWCTARFVKQPSSYRAIFPTEDMTGRRVLIVDDNESNRMILHHLVTGWGMVDDLAEDATTALTRVADSAARGLAYDLAILDVMMPGKDGLELAREFQQVPACAGMRIVVLTSLLQRGHAEQARQAGAMGYLPKPVRHDQLRECLSRVLGTQRGAAPTHIHAVSDLPPLVTRHTMAEQAKPHRILVAEDNIINQKLAVHMAEKLGYRSVVVRNGQEALDALANDTYAAVLMDCQMPVMDGFEATRLIREREASLRSRESSDFSQQNTPSPSRLTPHIPIIAITANAVQGDRERCLAAGMDDYLTKPVKMDVFRAMLERWVPAPVTGLQTPESQPCASGHHDERSCFDPDRMFHNIGSDQLLFTQLIELFLNQHPTMLEAIKEGLIKSDAIEVERAAHTLKGTAGNLCASHVASAASRLEAVGHLNRLQDAPPVYAQLEMEVLRLVRVLNGYCQGYRPASQQAA